MVTPRNVSFVNRDFKLVGDLYLPPTSAPFRHHAAMVIVHPWTGVKEQTAGLYASMLAEHGFVALAFDAAHQGESYGWHRSLEDPNQRAEDIKAAVSYLSALPPDIVDPTRIGALGICAAGGYVPYTAQADVRIAAVATVSAVCMGRFTREGLLNSPAAIDKAGLHERLVQAGEDRTTEARGGELKPFPMMPRTQADAAAVPGLPTLIKEATDYYRTPRAAHPRSTNETLGRNYDLCANYDSFHFNAMIAPRPLLMIAGGAADSLYFSEDGIAAAEEPKELFIVPGKTHFDLFDDLSGTSAKLVDFLDKALCGGKSEAFVANL